MSKKFSLPGSSKTPRGGTTNRGDFELILVHGSLQKKSPKTFGKMGVWQTRWFELTQTDLMYYSSQTDGVPITEAAVGERRWACENNLAAARASTPTD